MKQLFYLITFIMVFNVQAIGQHINQGNKTLTLQDFNGDLIQLSLGGSEGHGGDFREMNINNFGWQLFDKLVQLDVRLKVDLSLFKETLDHLHIVIVDDVFLGQHKRDAVNVPGFKKWYLSDESYFYILNENIDFNERAQFFLHEFLPLLNINDSDYRTSSQLVSYFDENHKDLHPLTEVLYLNNFKMNKKGPTFKNAKKLCESIKKVYEKDYFAISCLYKEKRFTKYKATYNYWSYFYKNFFKKVHVKRSQVTYRPYLTSPVYGLKVIGFGKNEYLKTKYIINGERDDMPTYQSYAMAKVYCNEIVTLGDDTDFTYYKAWCEAFPYDDGYRFHIKTKNPILD